VRTVATAGHAPRFTRITAGVAAIAAAVSVAACSSSGGSASTGNPYGLVQSGTIQSAITAGGAPFATTTKAGQPEGFLIDMDNLIAKNLGLTISYKVTTTDAALSGLTAGKYDLLSIGLVATPARAQNAAFSKPIYYGYNDVVVKAGSPVSSPAGLAGKRVGVSLGSAQYDYAQASLKSATLVSESLNSTAISQLTAGTVDAIVLGGSQAGTLMTQSPGKYKVAFSAQQSSAGAVAMSKKEPKLVAAYNAQLAKLVNNGTFLKLYDKWIAPVGAPFPTALYSTFPSLAAQVAKDPKANPTASNGS
jgi:polar amino acid transport system substrate-binding protein